MSTVSAVEQCLTDFLIRIKKMPESISPDLVLYADGIGLDSLETAELSAVLEDEFGTDPFAEGDMPQTVADIFAYYDQAAAAS